MIPRIDWGALLPPEVRAAVEPTLRRWLVVAPSWCHVIAVHWDEALSGPSESEGTTATMEARPMYREAVLTIGGGWLTESPDNRERIIRHELAHLPTSAMDDVFSRLLKQFKKQNPALHVDYEEQWRQAIEAATCDIGESYDHARNSA